MSVWEERVGPAAPEPAPSPFPAFRNRSTRGVARVVCYSPRHDTTLAELRALPDVHYSKAERTPA